MAAPKDPKEKVLHTRVPEALEADIKALADALRVPVSSLVRNILEDSVTVVRSATSGIDETLKKVTKDVQHLSKHVREDNEHLRRGWAELQTMLTESFKKRPPATADAAPPPTPAETAETAEAPAPRPFADVFGWQHFTLNQPVRCAGCGVELQRGQTAHLGLREGPGPRIIACTTCAGI